MFALTMPTASYNLWGRWIRPTAWDRVKQEEPLEPVEARFEPWVQDQATLPQSILISNYSMGTLVSSNITINSTDSSIVGGYYRTSGDNLTSIHNGPREPSTTVWDSLNRMEPKAELPDVYASNRRERKILEALGDKLPEAVRRASKVIGPPDGTAQWRFKFFEQVSRGQPATGRPHERNGAAQRRRAR